MLLISRRLRAVSARLSSDEGSVLAGVMGVMLFTLLITSVMLANLSVGIQKSTSTRADVQSQGAADAGLAVARAALINGTCATGSFVNKPGVSGYDATKPIYEAHYEFKSGASWVSTARCPTSSDTDMRIVSSGTAANKGVSFSANDKSKVEAVFSSPLTPTVTPATGQAVYSYGNATATGAGTVAAVTGASANVYVKNGSLVCDGGAGIAGDVVVPNGSVTVSGSCKIGGSIYSSGLVKITGGASGDKVSGNIIGLTVELSGGATVRGSVWATGIGGSSTLSSIPIVGSVYSNGVLTITDGSVGGNVVAAGTVSIATNLAGSVSAGGALNVTNNNTISGSGFAATGIENMKGNVVGNLVTTNGNISFAGGGKMTGAAYARNGLVTASSGQNIGGGVVAKNFKLSGSTVGGTSYVSLNTEVNNNTTSRIYTKTMSGSGTFSPTSNLTTGWTGSPTAPSDPTPPAAVAAPTAPTVPGWIDYRYNYADWSGYQVKTLAGPNCVMRDLYTQITALGTNNGVIDARNCTTTINMGDGFNLTASGPWVSTIPINSDVMILTNKLNMNNGAFTASSSHKLWLLQEDTVANNVPDCGGRSISASGGFTFATNLKVMIYTPCSMTLTSSQSFAGQINAGGGTTFSGAAIITFAPIGVPGYNLDAGTPASPTPTTRTWTNSIVRNISG